MKKYILKVWNKLAEFNFFFRFAIKSTLFLVVLFFVLYPDPVKFVKQVNHIKNTDKLIKSNFKEMKNINKKINERLGKSYNLKEEFYAIQSFVYKNITYSYDWINWGVVDYWPAADEVWERKKEDCDGRAILAVSILRSRGFKKAELVGSFRHIWAVVGDSELMGPDTEKNIEKKDGKLKIVVPSYQLMIDDLAFTLSEFPKIRIFIILLFFLILIYHPSTNLKDFLMLAVVNLFALILFFDWGLIQIHSENSQIDFMFILAAVIFLASWVFVLCRKKKVMHSKSKKILIKK